jgi:hypothetical protein
MITSAINSLGHTRALPKAGVHQARQAARHNHFILLGYVHSGTSLDMTRMIGIIASQYDSMEMTRTVRGPIDFSINTVGTEEYLDFTAACES